MSKVLIVVEGEETNIKELAKYLFTESELTTLKFERCEKEQKKNDAKPNSPQSWTL